MIGRKRREVTAKQAYIISKIIGILVFILIIIIAKKELCISIIFLALISALLIESFFYENVFKVTQKEALKKAKEMREEAQIILSKKDFRKIYFNFENFEEYQSDKIKMIEEIFQNENISFYAKLTDNAIYVIAKDKYGDEIYQTTIKNMLYFCKYFRYF